MLTYANENKNTQVVRSLVNDFPEVAEDELSNGFRKTHAGLLFTILKRNIVRVA